MTTFAQAETPLVEAPARLRWAWPWLLLAIWPLLLALSNSTWLYSNFWYDPFVYLGAYLRLPEQLRAWGNLYFYSRLAFLLPGYLAYHVLPPPIANAVLDFARAYGLIVTLFVLLRRQFGLRPALFTTLLLGGSSQFLVAVGWDYPDGAGALWLLVALWTISRAVDSARSWAWTLGAGLALGAGFHSHFFTLVFWPAVGLYWLLAQRGEWSWQRLFQAGFLILAGVAFVTAVLGVVSWAMGGQFLFFLSNLSFLGHQARLPGILFMPPSLAEILPYASWVMAPAIVAVATVGSLSYRLPQWRLWRNSPDKVFGLCYLAALVLLLAVGVRASTTILNRHYYVTYLLPFMALAVGGLLAGPLDQLSRLQWLALAGLVLVAVPAAIRISAQLNLGSAPFITQIGGWLALGSLSAAVIVLRLRRGDFWGLVVLTGAFALINPIGPLGWIPLQSITLATDDSQARISGFEMVLHSAEIIGSRWNQNTWLLFNEQLNPIHGLVACAVAACHQNIISRHYPDLSIQYTSLSAVQEFQPGRQLVLIDSTPGNLPMAIQATGETVTAPVLDAVQSVTVDGQTTYLSFYHEPVENWAIDLLPGRSMGFLPRLAQSVPADGSLASLPQPTGAGPLAYSGQFELPPGRYQALFTLIAPANSSLANAVQLEMDGQDGISVLDSKLVLRGVDLVAAANPLTFQLPFSIKSATAEVAALVYTFDLIPLRLTRFQLERVGD